MKTFWTIVNPSQDNYKAYSTRASADVEAGRMAKSCPGCGVYIMQAVSSVSTGEPVVTYTEIEDEE